MGKIDVSGLVTDTDFADTVTRVRRSSSVNTSGEHVLTEASSTITVTVTSLTPKQLALVPEGVRVSDAVAVYHLNELQTEGAGEYADILEWNGLRYKVAGMLEKWQHMGNGFGVALAVREEPYA